MKQYKSGHTTLRMLIVGYGRFGKTLVRMLSNYATLHVYDPFVEHIPKQLKASTLPDAYRFKPDYVFFAIPISTFAQVLKRHIPYVLKHNSIVVDVLSVKVHPYNVIRTLRRNKIPIKAILTHPMFGPDSSQAGFNNLPIVIFNMNAPTVRYHYLVTLFQDQIGLKVIELTPKQHDKMAAYSQGVTHFIGRMLEKFGFTQTPIDTLGARKLHEIMQQTTNDTLQLFKDLQHYNPYTRQMRYKLGRAYESVFRQLLLRKVNPPHTTIGIQGGQGSFNEMLTLKFVMKYRIKDYKIKYLYTTERVLTELDKGTIDLGIFAVHNAQGGIVWESARAMAKHRFSIKYELKMQISHHLMKLPNVPADKITTIMAHPQVLKQCKNTLQREFPHLKQTSGTGRLIDTAEAAKQLATGKLHETTAILGPKILSKLYNLEIIAENLQDAAENLTYFWVVTR